MACDCRLLQKHGLGDVQKEYLDAIDFRKMLQMVPGIGAVAGPWANYTIFEELRESAMNAYRIRRLNESSLPQSSTNSENDD